MTIEFAQKRLQHFPPHPQPLSPKRGEGSKLGARLIALLITLAAASTATAEPHSGLSTTGPITSSKLVALTSDGGVTLEAAGKRTNYSADKLVLWGQASEPRRGPVIVLADGSRIVAEPIALNSEELRIDSRLL